MSERLERDAQVLRVLVQRIRAGLWLLVLALVLFFAAYGPDGHLASGAVLAVKAVQLATLLWAFAMLRGAVTWRGAVGVALVVLAEVSVTTAVSGVLTAESDSIFLLFTVMTLATATLLPWGIVPQAATVAVAACALAGNLVAAPPPSAGLTYPLVAVLLAFATSLYIAHAFEQHRRARARAERDLRASEERKAAVIEAALDAIVTVDAGGRIVEFNPAAERTFGHARADVLGHPLRDVLTRGDGELTHHLTVGAPEALGRRIETTAHRADGTALPVELALLQLDDDGALRTGFVRDLTDRNLAIEARTASTLARVGREMLSSLDSALLFERLGLLTRELLGGVRSATLVHDAATRSYGGAGLPRVAQRELVAVVQRAALDAVAVLDAATAVRLLGPEAGPTLAIAVREDGALAALHLTTRERDADPFTAEQEHIAHGIAQVASLALTNAHLVEEIRRASQVKSEFLSTMSHELRTPLNAVLGYADMAGDPDMTADERTALLAQIQRAGARLLELVEHTLEIGRIEAGDDAPELERVWLPELWSTLRDAHARLHTDGPVVLEWPAAPDAALRTDARKLTVAIRHLVENALKFTERGTVRVTVAVDERTVTIAVEDTGIGIRPEDHALVFEMFRQVDGSETRRHGGTGLGLYLVRRFVHQLGGTVELESALGRGSRFILRVPRTHTLRLARRAA